MSKWLTKKLRAEIRQVFEPRYGKRLSDSEVEAIAFNLTELFELFKTNEKSNTRNNSTTI
jgi:hypothetical protein